MYEPPKGMIGEFEPAPTPLTGKTVLFASSDAERFLSVKRGILCDPDHLICRKKWIADGMKVLVEEGHGCCWISRFVNDE
jgi:hypothetical protein